MVKLVYMASIAKSPSKKENTNQPEGKYGLLSMIAIIVGTVMGSGIFIKNQSLMTDSQSVILTCIAWIIGGIVVISMMLAFLEVSSITKIKGEQGTFTNWSKRLFGEKTSKFVGVYFIMLFFPLVISSEAVYAGQKFTELSGLSETIYGSAHPITLNWILITVIAFIVLVTAFLINIIWIKPGKAFTSVISMVKIIPLLVVFLVAILVVGGLTIGEISEPNHIFDPNDQTFNSGLTGFGSSFKTVLLIMPGVMFAFDGFLYANSLSTETKSPNTFKNAAIIGIAIITTAYLTFSLGTFLIAQVGPDGDVNYTIGAIFNSMFPTLHIIADILIFIIFLSITSATFGYAISSQWSFADSSDADLIKDENGILIRRSKIGNPYMAGWIMFGMAAISVAFFRISDLMTISAVFASGAGNGIDDIQAIGSWSTPMSDFISDFYTLMDFVFYSLILVGVIMNRFTNKVEVEKVKGFFVFAITALVIVGLTTVVFGISLFWGGIIEPLTHGIDAAGIKSISKIICFTILVTIYCGSLYWVWTTTLDMPEEDVATKDVYRYAYSNYVSFEKFEEAIIDGKLDIDKAYLLIDKEIKRE